MEKKVYPILNEEVEVLKFQVIVVGSGAAGWNAAARLHQYGVLDIALITEDVLAGTSRYAGSDKQTYYKMTLSGDQEESVQKLAEVLHSGLCMDGEHAVCEAALSCQSFYRLVELGVPFPHNRYGEYIGYKTDHDPNHRGTSIGPYTSREMTEALEKEVRGKGITVMDRYQVIRLLVTEGKAYGVLCLNHITGKYIMIKCPQIIYATGGPAGIYQDSVYPYSQLGATGIALEAGITGKNLTEWQYGLASLKPRWNVSGSYMQVLPRFISTDQDGNDEKEFMLEYFESYAEMMDMIFLKGYQWPFDVRKVAEGSSIIDLLVYREICLRQRRVWLDYRKNVGNQPVNFNDLSLEVREYIEKTQMYQETPYLRLCQLNALAVTFYQQHGVDLEKEPLEVAICAQHNNGGLGVDGWWQTNINGIFAVGEVAGTHGVYRPGGSALNAGQVGSTRAAQYIATHLLVEENKEEIEHEVLEQIRASIKIGHYGLTYKGELLKARDKARRQMSYCGAMVRSTKQMQQTLEAINAELTQIETIELENEEAVGAKRTAILSEAFHYYDMLLSQKVYLAAMINYVEHGGRSRGSALYLEASDSPLEGQIVIPSIGKFSLDKGQEGHGSIVQEVNYNSKEKACSYLWRPVHPLPKREDVFEMVWKRYCENKNIE